MKALGIHWIPSLDKFGFKVQLTPLKEPITKRTLLSDIARLFDPLGWLTPTIILAKIILQQLWKLGLDWDENIQPSIRDDWLKLRQQLIMLENIHIHRWIGTNTQQKVELHGFCDASNVAYAAVVYSKIFNADGSINTQLIMAKSKVAPIKTVTLPRLELCGAVLLSKLLAKIQKSFEFQSVELFAWCDSTITLAWLKGDSSRWKTFVANRVNEVLSNININHWYFIASEENPADCASRGILPDELINHHLWWHGPTWLNDKLQNISSTPHDQFETNLEQRTITQSFHITTPESNFNLLETYSSINKLCRITALCQRFIANLKSKSSINKITGFVTPIEINHALTFWIKFVQLVDYEHEINRCRSGEMPLRKSQLLNLNPFVDKNNVLRVGGRLHNATIPFTTKHPVILSKSNLLTKLLVSQAHENTLHGGPNIMMAYLRKNYWIIGMRELVKRHYHQCVICFRYRAKTRSQIMASLPSNRITPARPFLHSGVDFAGPISIRLSKGCGYKSSKGYISVFVCLVTKALHLEAVSDLSTPAFLAAYHRFTARLGICAHLYSDNETNFVGAKNELERMLRQSILSSSPELGQTLSKIGTHWHMIPPASPHFGGLWEAGVKSVKTHLKKIIGISTLTFEELTTLLCQIEAILNSRPLCPMSNDSTDCAVLTAGHFLISDNLNSVPQPDLTISKDHHLTRWQYLQKLQQQFWKNWSTDYLHRLQQRPKWLSSQPNLKIGDIVIIKDERLPPATWALGRIQETHPGKDDKVRVVSVKTKDVIRKLPITKLCSLPENQIIEEL